MKIIRYFLLFAAAAGAVMLVFLLRIPANTDFKSINKWQRMAEPGALSKAHSFLENRCEYCHTPIRGAATVNCIVCHAGNRSILQRQPTAFHVSIANCRQCHPEHKGGDKPNVKMDHALFAKIVLTRTNQKLSYITPKEGMSDCAACHSTKDPHFGFFGKDCAQCHNTSTWKIPEFRHPSSNSTNCAQCHQPPPSHYMEHFKMVSAKVAGKPHAAVNQCYLCHQTTSWNDIKGVGFYKHH